AAIPQIREEVGVHFRINHPVALVKFGVSDVRRSREFSLYSIRVREGLGRGVQDTGDGVIVGSGPNRHARTVLRCGRVGVVVDRSRVSNGRVLSDEDIERIGINQIKQIGAGSVAAIYAEFIEALIDKSSVVTETADKSVVLDVEVAVDAGHVTPGVFIEERAAWAEIVNQTVTNRSQVGTERVKLRGTSFDPAIEVVCNTKRGRGKTVVLLGLGIHQVAVELEAVAQ